MQPSLFGPSDEPPPKPGTGVVNLQLLITVKAAPNPSEKYGETVCVAGIRTDLTNPGWVRLYPINHRDLASDDKFRKYDMISVDAAPASQDHRRESWRPRLNTLTRVDHLEPWKPRRAWLDTYVEDSMCRLNASARERSDAKSLALIAPQDVGGLKISRHPGWSHDEQQKIDQYVAQLDLLDDRDRTPLEAPRFKAAYKYRCHDSQCRGHEQGLLDWEFVALQRGLAHYSDDEIRRRLTEQFLDMMCAPSRLTAFYVGNQAKRAHVFSVLGVYYPTR
jgi:hypothetical protein